MSCLKTCTESGCLALEEKSIRHVFMIGSGLLDVKHGVITHACKLFDGITNRDYLV